MAITIDMYGAANQEERTVSGDFGTFTIVVRRPRAMEQVRMTALVFERNYEDLLPLHLSLLVGWKDIFGTDGKEVPFNDKTKDEVLSHSKVVNAILDSIALYCQESKIGEEQAKKSETPLVTSPES